MVMELAMVQGVELGLVQEEWALVVLEEAC
jgi:hypothetical protein